MEETPYRSPRSELGADITDTSARQRIALAGAAVIPLAGFLDTWAYQTAGQLVLDVCVAIAIGALAVLWIGADSAVLKKPAAFWHKVLAFILPPIGLLVYFGRSRNTRRALKAAALFIAYLAAIVLAAALAVMLGELIRYGEVQW